MLKITITRYIDKSPEEMEKEIDQINRNRNWNNEIRNVDNKKIDKILEVEVTEEQFEAIRKSVLEIF